MCIFFVFWNWHIYIPPYYSDCHGVSGHGVLWIYNEYTSLRWQVQTLRVVQSLIVEHGIAVLENSLLPISLLFWSSASALFLRNSIPLSLCTTKGEFFCKKLRCNWRLKLWFQKGVSLLFDRYQMKASASRQRSRLFCFSEQRWSAVALIALTVHPRSLCFLPFFFFRK